LTAAERNSDDMSAARRRLEELEGELSRKLAALEDANKRVIEAAKKLEEAKDAHRQNQEEVERLKKRVEELEAALKEARAVKPAPPIAKEGCCN
jgi:chromosome segregation ATPase